MRARPVSETAAAPVAALPRQSVVAVASLAVLTAVIAASAYGAGLHVAPPGLVTLPVILGGLFLAPRQMAWLLTATTLVHAGLLGRYGLGEYRAGNLVLHLAVSLVAYRLAAERADLGLPGLGAGSMLLEVRDRLRRQGEIRGLPRGWRVEVAIRAAGGAGFSGDFLVSCVQPARAELALVDVSGKGVEAGSRALLLSGALGGLLGAVPAEQFLGAANAYLLRQRWDEGFASAVHLALDLRTGEYLLQSAGHPPAAQFSAGTGYWATSAAAGAVLGVLDEPSWRPEAGQLRRGDALLLYTDGLIELPGRDLSVGIDKLLGEANRLVVSTFEGGAERLLDTVARDASDDRALVLLWRE
ncbi:MAG TPA: PP2C family protein-serine/threonine phosphatase [Mycobacteriales bacterium]|nr:PP2C family protein-serine/threonine phosphatase [Mycobacteriales bacterium]